MEDLKKLQDEMAHYSPGNTRKKIKKKEDVRQKFVSRGHSGKLIDAALLKCKHSDRCHSLNFQQRPNASFRLRNNSAATKDVCRKFLVLPFQNGMDKNKPTLSKLAATVSAYLGRKFQVVVAFRSQPNLFRKLYATTWCGGQDHV